MKKTIKNGIVQNVYGLLDKAKFNKSDAAARRAVFGVMYPMKKVAEECEDFQREAAKRLQPENYQEIADAITEFNGMSTTEREAALKQPKYVDALKVNYLFNQELNKCVSEYMNKDAELDVTPLSDTVFDALCDANSDWTLGQCMELQAILCDGQKTED